MNRIGFKGTVFFEDIQQIKYIANTIPGKQTKESKLLKEAYDYCSLNGNGGKAFAKTPVDDSLYFSLSNKEGEMVLNLKYIPGEPQKKIGLKEKALNWVIFRQISKVNDFPMPEGTTDKTYGNIKELKGWLDDLIKEINSGIKTFINN